MNSQGPIVKGKTSVTFSAEGNDSYDSQTVVAATSRRARCADRCAVPTTW